MSNKKQSRSKKNKGDTLSNQWQEIDGFFEFFEQAGAQKDLWKMLKLALINENTTGRERSNMIFVYEYTVELYVNTFALLQEQKEKTK